MRFAKWIIEGESPSGSFDVLQQALEALRVPGARTDLADAAILSFFHNPGVKYQLRRVIVSDEFQTLGITDQINAAIVDQLNSDTVEALTGKSEAELLAVEGFGYRSLLQVNRKLSERDLQLQGDPIPVADRIEQLPFDIRSVRSAYEFLKKHGIDRISQLKGLDIVALHRILGQHLEELLRVLDQAEQDLRPAPLAPTRTVGDLLKLYRLVEVDPFDLLLRAGFSADTYVHNINVQNLRSGLAQIHGLDEGLDYWVDRIRSSLAEVGYQLPDGPGELEG